MAAEQERRSRMAYTTYKAPAKKDGAGGMYTWGSRLDSATFYDARVTSAPGVTLAPAPAAQPSTPVAQTLPVLKDNVAFPTLGSAPKSLLNSQYSATVSNTIPQAAPMPAKVLVERIVSTRSIGSVDLPPQDFAKNAQPVAYQSRQIEQDRRSRMAYTTYKEPAKKDGAGGTYTWGSPLDSSTFYESSVTTTAGVTLAPAPVVEQTIAVAQTLPDIQDPLTFPTLTSVTLESGIATEAVMDRNVAEEIVEIEFVQGMEESEGAVAHVVNESVVVTEVFEEKRNAELIVVTREIEEVIVPQEVVKAESPSEVSAEETPREDTSNGVPTKPVATTTCMQGCFEWMSSRRS